MPVASGQIDGTHILYHYLQKQLLRSDIWLFQMLCARLVVSLGVWFSPTSYRRLPVMLPFAVRDPEARGNRARGIPDQWGSPNADGLFRDDNSLVKGLARAVPITSDSNPLYDRRRIGAGFVASHVWRELPTGLAARDPLTYSFVPNLVWLPAQVAKLTDREGSFVQTYLQALSRKIFRDVEVRDGVADITAEAWARIETADPRSEIPEEGLPTMEQLNFFEPKPAFFTRRIEAVRLVVAALRADERSDPSTKVISTRYGDGLRMLSTSRTRALASRLELYLAGLSDHA